MDVARAGPRRTIDGVHITDASSQSVVTHDAGGDQQIYLRSAIGWRRDTGQVHHADLVTNPALNALLDSAAANPD